MKRFKCESCEEVFEIPDDWTEENRISEMRNNIGDAQEDDRVEVCDDCYQKILPSHPRIGQQKLDPRVESVMNELEHRLFYGEDKIIKHIGEEK